jgi:transcriptional regulator NrdR family protein
MALLILADMRVVIKRKGKEEAFDHRKLYASIFAACSVIRMKDQEAEMIADKVTSLVEKEIKHDSFVAAEKVHKVVVSHLRQINADIAYIYDNHKDIS